MLEAAIGGPRQPSCDTTTVHGQCDSLALVKGSCDAGLYFGAKESSYFAVGKITKDQVHNYADRKKMAREEAEKWLNTMLCYEP